jgi:hypothetical protein
MVTTDNHPLVAVAVAVAVAMEYFNPWVPDYNLVLCASTDLLICILF